MPIYRVYFQRSSTVQLYLDVKAKNETDAQEKANDMTVEGDAILTEIPETYDIDIGPTGEVVEQ